MRQPLVDLSLVALGFLVGTLVGMTGVGGAAVLTPLLILAAGVRPITAIGTDLAFAAITKAVGSWQHARLGTCDWSLVARLACGSVPGALVGTGIVGMIERANEAGADTIIARLLGIALLLAAGASFLRAAGWLQPADESQPPLIGTLALGFVIGIVVGVTSIGAGSLLMATFALLYGLSASRAVGTDVVHGAILAAVAAVGHGTAGRIEIPMLVTLLAGSVPGVLLGGWLCARMPAQPLRVGIGVMLAITGLRLI
jgi:uncharacterized membrane protein YfcA